MRKNDSNEQIFNLNRFLLKTNKVFQISVALLFLPVIAQGQTTVVLDDFNRAPSELSTGGPNMGWVVNKIDNENSKLQIFSTTTPTTLQIYNDNTVDNSGINGRSYLTGSLDNFLSPFKKKLNENETVTWTFNMRNSKASPTDIPHVNGLLETGDNNYAQLVVLVSTNADFLDATANGYAVSLIRDQLNSTIFKLVRFTGGLSATSNLTTLVESTPDKINGSFWASVKVVYVSATNTWSLHLRDDGSTANAGYKDPMNETVGAYTSIGSVVNNMYTSTEMTSCGFFANTGIARAGSSAKANYANFGVRVALSTGYTPILSIDYKIRSIQHGFAIDVEQAKVDVYNSIGILQQSADIKGTHQFIMNNPGMYILRISLAKGETSTICLVR